MDQASAARVPSGVGSNSPGGATGHAFLWALLGDGEFKVLLGVLKGLLFIAGSIYTVETYEW